MEEGFLQHLEALTMEVQKQLDKAPCDVQEELGRKAKMAIRAIKEWIRGSGMIQLYISTKNRIFSITFKNKTCFSHIFQGKCFVGT